MSALAPTVPAGAPADAVQHLRQAILDRGYAALAVVNHDASGASAGKRPAERGWPELARSRLVIGAAPATDAAAINTGIECSGLRAVDIDVADPDIARKVCAAILARHPGALVRHRGNVPRLVLLAAAHGEPGKRALAGSLGKVEVLGSGQQFVAYGRHHTGAPLLWAPEGPATRERDALPQISEAEVTALLAELAPLIGSEGEGPHAPSGDGAARAERGAAPAIEGVDDPAAIAAATGYLQAAPPAVMGMGGDDRTYKTALQVRDRGASEAACFELMAAHYNERCEPPWAADELRSIVAHAYAYGQNREGAKHPEADFAGVRIEPPILLQPPKPARRLQLRSPAECEAAPTRPYIVKGLIAAADAACIYGEPGAGKSVLAPHLAYAVAQGRPAFGRRTKQGRVLYVAAEDSLGMRRRVHALKRHYGDAPAFSVVEGIGSLVDKAEAAELLAVVKEQRPALMVIDTLAAAWPAIEENSSEGMGLVTGLVKQMQAAGAAVILIHHPAKDGGTTPRGFGGLFGMLDVAIPVERDRNGIVRGRLTKNRNGGIDSAPAFRIQQVVLGRDAEGDAITTVIAEEIDPAKLRGEAPKLPGSQKAALDILNGLVLDQGEERNGRLVVSEKAWRAACVASRKVSAADDAKSRADSTARAIRGLAATDQVCVADGYAWPRETAWRRSDPRDDFGDLAGFPAQGETLPNGARLH